MRVLTEKGSKLITDIKVGDKVLTVDESGKKVISEVLETYAARNYHYFLINNHIKATALHPFRTETGWKKTEDLETRDRIQTSDGSYQQIFSIKWKEADLEVYNLHIKKNHNFFVSTDGKNGYLVHNTPGGAGAAGAGGTGIK